MEQKWFLIKDPQSEMLLCLPLDEKYKEHLPKEGEVLIASLNEEDFLMYDPELSLEENQAHLDELAAQKEEDKQNEMNGLADENTAAIEEMELSHKEELRLSEEKLALATQLAETHQKEQELHKQRYQEELQNLRREIKRILND